MAMLKMHLTLIVSSQFDHFVTTFVTKTQIHFKFTAQFQHNLQKYTGTDGFPVCSPTLMDFLLLKRSSVAHKPRTRVRIPKGKS